MWSLLSSWGPGPLVAQQNEALRFAQAYQTIDQYVEQQMSAAHTPGRALAVTNREGLLRVSAYGFADTKARIPVTPETRFEIGSISKSFAAIAVLQLRKQGKVDVDKPLTDYLPWLGIDSRYAPITVHHFLTHTAGIQSDRDDVPSSLYQPLVLAEKPTGYAPGTRFAYSNVGYETLSVMVEQLTGKSFPEVTEERILRPLGMTHSDPAITHDSRRQLAVGYVPMYDDRPARPSDPLVEGTWLEYGAGDANLASTPADLAAYLRMLLNHGVGPNGRIISEEDFGLMTQRTVIMDQKEKPPVY